MSEVEQKALDESVIKALSGAKVVVEGAVGLDATLSLTEEGAQDVVDRLRARGFKVVRD